MSRHEGLPQLACPTGCLFRQVIPALRTVHHLLHMDARRRGKPNGWVAIPHLSRWRLVGDLLRPPATLLADLRAIVLRERSTSMYPDQMDMRLRGGPAARAFDPERDLLASMFDPPLPKDDQILLSRHVAQFRLDQHRAEAKRAAAQASSTPPSPPQLSSAFVRPHGGTYDPARDPRLRQRRPTESREMAAPVPARRGRECFTPDSEANDAKRPCEVDTPPMVLDDDSDIGLPALGDPHYNVVTAERDPPALRHYRASAPQPQLQTSPPSLEVEEPYRIRNPAYEGFLTANRGQRIVGTLQVENHMETGVYNVIGYPDDSRLGPIRAQAFWSSLRNPAEVPFPLHQRVAESTLRVVPSRITAGILTVTKSLDGCSKVLFQSGTSLFEGNIIPFTSK